MNDSINSGCCRYISRRQPDDKTVDVRLHLPENGPELLSPPDRCAPLRPQ